MPKMFIDIIKSLQMLFCFVVLEVLKKMSFSRPFVDISNEFILKRHGNGIKLVEPEGFGRDDMRLMFGNIMKLPMYIGFNYPKHTVVLPNQFAAETMCFDSTTDMVGKTILDYLTTDSALPILSQHEVVMDTSRMSIVEQQIFRAKDNLEMSAVTLIFPWYGKENQLNGTVNFSSIQGSHALNKFFSLINSLGLLNIPSSYSYERDVGIQDKFNLSNREKNCIDLVMTGKKYKEIADILSLSQRTVEHYIQNIKAKFNVSTKAELILKINEFMLN